MQSGQLFDHPHSSGGGGVDSSGFHQREPHKIVVSETSDEILSFMKSGEKRDAH